MTRMNTDSSTKTVWEYYADLAVGGGTAEQRFLAAAQAGRNCFLTGMAGTGKSTTLRQFIRDALNSPAGPTWSKLRKIGGFVARCLNSLSSANDTGKAS